VRAGHAWWYQQYDRNDAEMEVLEVHAREARMGLWHEPIPCLHGSGARRTRRAHGIHIVLRRVRNLGRIVKQLVEPVGGVSHALTSMI
jgi:hypothetical protein